MDDVQIRYGGFVTVHGGAAVFGSCCGRRVLLLRVDLVPKWEWLRILKKWRRVPWRLEWKYGEDPSKSVGSASLYDPRLGYKPANVTSPGR